VKINATVAGYSGSYQVHIKPYENYTFHIRSNATFQDGSKVTAWDVAFSIIRTLLFDAGVPDNPGWIQAQYLLPGDYYTSNTFWNITQNITWNNATNNVTFHFQQPMTPSLVFEILGDTSGAFITEASWVQLHGGGIGWNATDFLAYKAHGNAGNYIPYLVDHVMSSGPYEIDYTVPASEVVLLANKNYNPPGNGWEPKPSIPMVIIEYISAESTQYLQLKSGYASAASNVPTSNWYEIQGLQKAKQVTVSEFPTITIYWYEFNTNINESLLAKIFPGSNVPQAFFASVQVRRAFADAYNENYYLSRQLGNDIYNTTFGSPYAGMLPTGMLGAQTIPNLQAAGVSLPQFNLTYAEQNWTEFEHSAYFAADGLSIGSNGYILYNGAPLNIPIAVFTSDPTDVAGATTWGSYLSQIIPGATFPVEPTPNPVWLSWLVAGQNPGPILESLWAPDYPYPTDYLGQMAYPNINTDTTGPDGFYPSWFNASSDPVSGVPGMAVQYQNLTEMVNEYQAGAAATNQSLAIHYFHQLNEMLINMTEYVFLYQLNEFWIVNSKVPQSEIVNNEENVMQGGSLDLLYCYLSYS
ncbi:MAG: ABC transporter substrate-binding protein, partial [Thermoplasmatales archaeon]